MKFYNFYWPMNLLQVSVLVRYGLSLKKSYQASQNMQYCSLQQKNAIVFPEVHWITITTCRSDSKFSIGQFFVTCFFFTSESGQSQNILYLLSRNIALTAQKYLLQEYFNSCYHSIYSSGTGRHCIFTPYLTNR